jgi:DNA polymerase-1
MPHNTVIVRRNKKVSITGNCQQELRIAAFISNDKKMKNAYEKNIDIHMLTANSAFDLGLNENDLINDGSDRYKDIKSKYKEYRNKAKIINFQIIYGAGSYSLSQGLNVTEEEAQKVIDNYLNTYSGIKESIEKTHKEVEEQGYVTNFFGRIRHFKNIDASYKDKLSAFRESFNFKIQSFGAELIKTVSNRIFKEFKNTDLDIVMFVHDEIVFICKEENVDKYIPKLKKIMEEEVSINPKLLVEEGVGNNYSEAK